MKTNEGIHITISTSHQLSYLCHEMQPIDPIIYDVAIIGAGPAGCACALTLSKSGLKVLLVDKETFPRDKICGDAVPGASFKAMEQISPAWAKAMYDFSKKEDIRKDRIFAPNGKSFELTWVNYAYNSKRFEFDNFLMNLVKSDTQTIVIENKRIVNVNVTKNEVQCIFDDGTAFQAKLMIGCDGANSLVNRQLLFEHTNETDHATAVRSYYTGVTGISPNTNEFHFFGDLLPGYFWIFPLDNGVTNVGFGILSGKGRKFNLRNTLQEIIRSRKGLSERFQHALSLDGVKGFALPLGTKKRPVSGERFMLCGDAAALIDPFGAHGIDHALWSGLFAAEQAVLCFQANDFTAETMKNYDRKLYKKIGQQLSKGTIVLKLTIHFPFIINLLSGMARFKKITAGLVKILKI